jgi:hypothetical protein
MVIGRELIEPPLLGYSNLLFPRVKELAEPYSKKNCHDTKIKSIFYTIVLWH